MANFALQFFFMALYLDNAATTPMAPEVIEVMTDLMCKTFGNPSSSHAFGREAKGVLETSRRNIAKHLNCDPKEIVFTSGGTEADNLVFHIAINDLKIERIVSTEIEHHAVELTATKLAAQYGIELVHLPVDAQGKLNPKDLSEALKDGKKSLVSLMHANNEIGTKIDLHAIGKICRDFGAYFHSDTVQTMGHYAFDLKQTPIDFITCAGHKFHGPKGIGFLYVNQQIKYSPMIYGGAQERGFRGGTENLIGIAGLSKAFDLAYSDLEEHQRSIQKLKHHFKESLEKKISGIQFNGCVSPEESLYTVLNVSFPPTPKAGMLLFMLDLKGVACSGGSACSSGSNQGSHVLNGIGANPDRPSIRFSFSRYTTKQEVDDTITIIQEILAN
jgi:cysteine desulfurase